ncbi:hypothetical protein XFF6992_270014 [Xanthomonas citri pv. fuscans]|nr:hypothetical protein XFF6992_270014 [Xanthomonas citri pv. fuscans]SOO35487.1 hypothetical protein XFF6994_5370039 [Xanthomonas citri pv. fuscans]
MLLTCVAGTPPTATLARHAHITRSALLSALHLVLVPIALGTGMIWQANPSSFFRTTMV